MFVSSGHFFFFFELWKDNVTVINDSCLTVLSETRVTEVYFEL